METTQASDKQSLSFQAEVKQLLHLMIHSLYSNKEIFLRELISNASDACDKLRFEAIARPELIGDAAADLAIRVGFDPAQRTLTVSDNGIGMSREDVISQLGTIAKSGTREFFAQLTGDQQKDAQLIGQFGVGFYSSFIVADRVTVISRRAGDEQAVKWESDGSGEFTVETAARASHGTDVILHLKEGEDELLSAWKLKSILTRYSDHISTPIRMRKEEWLSDANKMDANEMRQLDEEETVNQANALWARARSDISDEQYREFYKHVAHEFGEPLAWTHNRVEGRTEYIQLLYLPERAQFDLWDRTHRHGIKLYVRRVFIMDDAEQLMPPYLRFVRGVIDSNDLPLNVSREILQESRDVKAIREGSTKRVLGLLEDLAENQPEKYATFWREFGQVLKEGIGDDPANRERISKLLRFASTSTEGADQPLALAAYVARMKPGQNSIYYLTADSQQAARTSPHLEIFRKKGVEVLLLTDRVDEWLLSFLHEFDGKPLVSVAKGDLDLGELADETEKAEQSKTSAEYGELVAQAKQVLADRVKDVRVSFRLTDSPACLVADEHEMSSHLQRLLKAAGQPTRETKPILEINPGHALVLRMKADEQRRADWLNLLVDQAILAEGGQLEDPGAFVRRMNAMLLDAAK